MKLNLLIALAAGLGLAVSVQAADDDGQRPGTLCGGDRGQKQEREEQGAHAKS